MWEPCRICGDRVPGAQCRWLFGKCGRLQPAVVLARVLGCNLHRDGSSELLCGKCMFLLECVLRCDIAIEDLQNTHTAQLQRLQRERSRLSVLITQKYWRSNSQEQDRCKTNNTGTNQEFQSQSACDHAAEKLQKQTCKKSELKQWRNEAKHLEWPKKQQNKLQRCLMGGDARTTHPGSKINKESDGQHQRIKQSQLRRSVSLSFGRSLLAQNSSVARFKAESSMATGFSTSSHKYSDLILRKCVLTSCTTSVSSTQAITTPPRLRQTQPLRGSLLPLGDLLQLLRGIRPRPLPWTVGTRIPVQLKPSGVSGHAHVGKARLVRAEQAVRELEEEFNDEYLALKPEVHSFNYMTFCMCVLYVCVVCVSVASYL
ncbi:uncharacterized protein LOC128320322 [Pangasianodon hypophthalmus]|uniref:uncharacterized protein LOC128320322 n=1 Tax=Pangasianodon hypophthalmus TaxID=310915 RepID=UPI0023077DEE|nr:uncharacterized protein LOC128320322 [Pangasianodon hypophthalmus]